MLNWIRGISLIKMFSLWFHLFLLILLCAWKINGKALPNTNEGLNEESRIFPTNRGPSSLVLLNKKGKGYKPSNINIGIGNKSDNILRKPQDSRANLVTCKVNKGCPGTCKILSSTVGEIYSPNFPKDYGNNADCSFTLETSKEYTIKLKFDIFSVEKSRDYVTVDGSRRLDGYKTPFKDPNNNNNPFFTSQSGKMLVKFKSNTGNGQIPVKFRPGRWKATYNIVPKPTPTRRTTTIPTKPTTRTTTRRTTTTKPTTRTSTRWTTPTKPTTRTTTRQTTTTVTEPATTTPTWTPATSIAETEPATTITETEPATTTPTWTPTTSIAESTFTIPTTWMPTTWIPTTTTGEATYTTWRWTTTTPNWEELCGKRTTTPRTTESTPFFSNYPDEWEAIFGKTTTTPRTTESTPFFSNYPDEWEAIFGKTTTTPRTTETQTTNFKRLKTFPPFSSTDFTTPKTFPPFSSTYYIDDWETIFGSTTTTPETTETPTTYFTTPKTFPPFSSTYIDDWVTTMFTTPETTETSTYFTTLKTYPPFSSTYVDEWLTTMFTMPEITGTTIRDFTTPVPSFSSTSVDEWVTSTYALPEITETTIRDFTTSAPPFSSTYTVDYWEAICGKTTPNKRKLKQRNVSSPVDREAIHVARKQ